MIALLPIAILFAELWLLVEVGSSTSAMLVLALCIATFGLGLGLTRLAMTKVRALVQPTDDMSTVMTPLGVLVMQRRRRPALAKADLFDALGLVLAGVFLLIPGFLSDAVGLMLLVAPLRRAFIARVHGVRYAKDPAEAVVKAARKRPTHSTIPEDEVDVLPPGTLPETPFRKRPVVIDVE